MTDLMKLFAEMDSMGVEELMRQSWQRSFGIMRHLRGEGKFCDVTLHCEMATGANRNTQSPPLGLVAHKVVLVSWSGYFRNLMDVGLFEEVEVIVPGVSHRALSWLLDLMYGETQPAVNEDNVDTIFQAAMILQVPLAVSLCAQMMKQRRRSLGDIVSSTIPEVDAGDSNAPRNKVTGGANQSRSKPTSSAALPVLHRGVKVEAPQPHAPQGQDCQSSSSTPFFPRIVPQSNNHDDRRISVHPSDDGRFGHESDGDDCLDSNSNQRRNSGSPYRPYEVPPPSLVATSPKRQIISATRTPIFKPKSRNGPRPIAAKTSSAMEHIRQSSAPSVVNAPNANDEGEAPAPPTQTLFVPMPTLTPTSVPTFHGSSVAFPGMVGPPGLPMTALGALQLAPVFVSSSSVPSPSPHMSTSPEGDADGDEGRLVINEEDHDFDDSKGNKGLKVRSKRPKVTGMELVPVGDDPMDGTLIQHSPKGNLTVVAICNICQKGFTSKTGYKKHIRTHMGAFPYHCPVCNKGYFDHYTLQEHLNAHKGLKVHGCTGCGKKYQRKKNLVIHQRTCTGVPDSVEVDVKEGGFTPEGSEVRMLGDGQWSENGSESLHEEEDGARPTEEGEGIATGDHRRLNGDGRVVAIGAAASAGRTGMPLGESLKAEEDCGMMVTESEEGRGMILVSPTKREPSESTSTTAASGYSAILPKGTLIKQLLKRESISPSLTKQQRQQRHLHQHHQLSQQSSPHALEERRKSDSAFATATAATAAASSATQSPTSRFNDAFSNDAVASNFPSRGVTSTPSSTPPSTNASMTAEEAFAASIEESMMGNGASSGAAAGKEKFQCPHCDEILTGRKNLQDHLAKVHAQPEKFTCPTCGRIFKYMTSLAHHIQSVCHGNNVESDETTMTTATTSAGATQTLSSGRVGGKEVEHGGENPGSPPPMTKSPSAAAQTSPLTPPRKSRRISKRHSSGGHENCEPSTGATNLLPAEGNDADKKNVGKVLQMQGVEGGELTGGYVILNEEEA